METRKKTPTPRMDRKGLILTVVGALLVVAIIVIAVVLMQRSRVNAYRENYETAMEHYVAGEYDEAISAAQLAYSEDATEEAVLIIARSYASLGNYDAAISALEQWISSGGSGSGEAASLLEQYRSQSAEDDDDGESVTIAGEKYPLDTETLVIADTRLTDADIEAISTLTSLTSLSLNNCSITDVSALNSLRSLVELSLEDNDITELDALSHLTELTALYLGGNENMGSLEPLYSLKNLRTLDIRGREISDEEFEELQTALDGCSILTDEPVTTDISLGGRTFKSDVTELDLSGLGLTDISALADCTQLEYLDLSSNEISDISVLAAMPNLRTLDLTDNNVSNISPLLALTKLEVLRLGGNSVSNIAALTNHSAIRELTLDGNPIGSFDALSTLTGLNTLSLQGCGVDDGDLEVLKTMNWLDKLMLEGNSGLTIGAVEQLSAALTGTEISAPEELYSVQLGSQSFPADSTFVDAGGLGVTNLGGIGNFTALVTLDLSDNPGIDISNIGAVPTLQNLELARCELSDISALERTSGLLSLNLMQNNITDVSALRHLTSLTELHLSLNEDLEDISPLASLKSLKTLSINNTAVTDISALSGMTDLEVLDIENCDIEDITALYSLKNLRTLYAAGCGLTQQEINQLGAQLPNCTIYT